MAERREAKLQRRVGSRMLMSIVSVNLAMAVFVSLGVVADQALGLTPMVFVVAGLVLLGIMLAYLEGTLMLPQAGGAAGFARRGLGELWSFLAGWALLLDYLILVTLTSYFAVHYVGSLPGMSWLLHRPTDAFVTGAFIVIVALVTMRGIRTGARIGRIVALTALLALGALALVGLVLFVHRGSMLSNVDLGVTPTWDGVLYALPIALIGFTGLDTIANFGEELEGTGRAVSRPVLVAALVSTVTFVVMSVVALDAQPVHGHGVHARTALGTTDGWVDRPVIGIIDSFNVPHQVDIALRTVFALLAAAVLFFAAASAVSAMGRVAYAMSRYRQAPSALFRINRGSGVPRRAVVLLTGVALVLLAVTTSVASGAVVLAQMYAFGATLTTFLAGVSILRLRVTEPQLDRPFRAPGNLTVGGAAISVPVLLGTLGSGVLWLLVMWTHDAARALGLVWMLAGFVAYGTYRITHGLPFAQRARERHVHVARIDANPYRRILVAVRPQRGMLYGAGDAELVGLAHKLLDADDERPADVSVILVHELPLSLPLDSPLGEVEQQTSGRLAKIRQAAASVDMRLSSSVARARAAGRAICQEAQRRQSDVVLLATRVQGHARADACFGRCVSYVVRHAPCDVVVLGLPERTLAQNQQQVSSAVSESATLRDPVSARRGDGK